MQLLVSPRSVEEATHSLSADIIDVKRPEEGSLGANFPSVIRRIRALTTKPVSAAIGDFDYRPGGASLAALGAASAGADYIKIGLMFEGNEHAREVIRAVVHGVKDDYPEKLVVIAAYSDCDRVGSISPHGMVPLAAAEGADVVMVDTGKKDGKSTLAFMPEAALGSFIQSAHDHGLRAAIAGGLMFPDIPVLRRVNPDIIGVRGMVCGGDRNAAIRPELVEQVLKMIR
ncbi:MAG: (5-formylfuran-3-yl)methyl phosphate synthase [Methanomicrobiales archaeon]|nr:(5-formylfuran-3-yl)methyl phosphate synthase [Methanomicrobiales archaeon]